MGCGSSVETLAVAGRPDLTAKAVRLPQVLIKVLSSQREAEALWPSA